MAAGSRRVIAGVSGSIRSLAALRAAVEEARSSGAPLQAVLAWAPAGGELAYARAPCPVLLRLWEQEACQRLLDAINPAFGGMPRDVAICPVVVRGPAGPVLVQLADRRDDLLVVGYGGRGWLGRVTHGEVTRYCIAHARCPVLTVPPPDLIQQLRPWRHLLRPGTGIPVFSFLTAPPALLSHTGAAAGAWVLAGIIYLACQCARHPGRIAGTHRMFTGPPPATTAESAAGRRREDMT